VFDVAGFTNLSQDHLDFHHDMATYFAAKASLFTPARSRRGCVVVDDAWGQRLVAEAAVPVEAVVTSVAADPQPPADVAAWRVVDARAEDGRGTRTLTVRTPRGATLVVRPPLPGLFNEANAALAVALAAAAGVPAEEAAAAVATAPGVPGRMETVPGRPGQDPLVVVDYAHTPDAVTMALDALRPPAGGRLLVVLGAGGDRDRAKRPAMGAAAARGADLVVVTDDNPRSEDPAAIRAALLQGARTAAGEPGARPVEVLEVADREEAVGAAIMRAEAGDVVLVAGKGHEQGQEVAGRVQPFDDRAVSRQWLARRAEEATP
jgi:UDP-N-acetylmuramoyl-L-alanyl-D-glutamate--2,6-diaminopimelate ligase